MVLQIRKECSLHHVQLRITIGNRHQETISMGVARLNTMTSSWVTTGYDIITQPSIGRNLPSKFQSLPTWMHYYRAKTHSGSFQHLYYIAIQEEEKRVKRHWTEVIPPHYHQFAKVFEKEVFDEPSLQNDHGTTPLTSNQEPNPPIAKFMPFLL